MRKVATVVGLGLLLVGILPLTFGAQAPAPTSQPQAESAEAIKRSNQEKVT